MNHEQIKEKIFDVYDGEGAPEERVFLQSHLSSCSECRHEVEQWQKTAAVFFQSQAPLEVTDHFVTRVMARLPQDQKGGSGFLVPFLKLGLVAGGFFVAVWSYLSVSSPDSIETLLLADSRSATVSNWIMDDKAISSDEFANFTLGEE